MRRTKHLACCISAVLTAAMLSAYPVHAGNAEETPDYQLQTLLIDNDGKNLWTTESWGGANILPNTGWTTTDAYDYYYNGVLTFEAKSNASEPLSFWIGQLRQKPCVKAMRVGKPGLGFSVQRIFKPA